MRDEGTFNSSGKGVVREEIIKTALIIYRYALAFKQKKTNLDLSYNTLNQWKVQIESTSVDFLVLLLFYSLSLSLSLSVANAENSC